jgi:DNA-directed RNA polymerase subunit L
MAVRGYITFSPTITNNQGAVGSTDFRDAIANADTIDQAKQIYTKHFGEYNKKLFNLIYKKIRSIKMNEQLAILRKLAGLPLMESAPVNFSSYEVKHPKLQKVSRLLSDEIVSAEPELSGALGNLSAKFEEAAAQLDPDLDEVTAEISKQPKELQQELIQIVSRAIKDVESGRDADLSNVNDGPASDMQDYSVMDSVDNEFAALEEMYHKAVAEESAKPDFADIDGDGDEEEPMKKAAEDKEDANEEVDESLEEMRKLAGLPK